MCMEHIIKSDGVEYAKKVKFKIVIAHNCGKSKNYINRLLQQGCHMGKKRCKLCRTRCNGGKSIDKGKGKNKLFHKDRFFWR